jgi:two-component system cell cycle response regulator DivK
LLSPIVMKADVSPLVLLVEDDRDTREMYRTYLTYSGVRVAEAPNAFQALERAHEQRPDIVVTDIAMPGMDGLELSRKLREEPPTRDVPIIALSGQASSRAREAGFDVVLEKPCMPDALLSAIQQVLHSHR